MPRGKSALSKLSSLGSTLSVAGLFRLAARLGAATLSVASPTVPHMASTKTPRLRVVRTQADAAPEPAPADAARRDYWARVQELRAEHRRLRAG